MILLLLGFALIVLGFILLGIQLGPLALLKTAAGRLVAYERGTTGFHPIIAFSFATNKFMFRNATPFEFPRYAIGTEHRVYFDPAKSMEIQGSPAKATINLSRENILLPWIVIIAGITCIALFSQVTGLYFLFVLFLVGLALLFGLAQRNFYFAEFFKNYSGANHKRYPLSDTFDEDKFDPKKALDLPSLKIFREQWLKAQRMKGFVFAALAILCAIFTDFEAATFTIVPVKSEVVEKVLTADQVIDAGSVEAAESELNKGKLEDGRFCFSFESESCYYSYQTLTPEGSSKVFDKFINLLIADIGFIFLLLAITCLYSRKIFIQFDTVDSAPKSN